MDSRWLLEPWRIFASAAATTVGGVVVFLVALNLGFMLAYDGFDWMAFWFGGLLNLGVACIALWGLIPAAILSWLAYRLLHDDASRIRTGIAVFLLSLGTNLGVRLQVEGTWLLADELIRLLLGLAGALLLLAAHVLAPRIVAAIWLRMNARGGGVEEDGDRERTAGDGERR